MQHADHTPAGDRVHKSIVKSTAILGGSSAINVVLRIVQSKAAAVLIGATGIGLMGVFISVLGMATMLAGMGLGTSGVRQIAEASGSGDEGRLARTVIAFRHLTLFFGIVGALIFFALRAPIAQLTFGDDQYAETLGWLSIAVLFTVLSSAQLALIRGMRRMGDLARASVIGMVIGTFIGLPLLFFWGTQGVAPYLIFNAFTAILVSWWYVRDISLSKVSVALRDQFSEMRVLLSLGVVFMATGMTSLATTYLVRVIITRQLGLEVVGLYEAANMVSSVYVGFILTAMAADFFPHLSSVSKDRARSGHLINAQVEIGLLIAAPGILAVLAFGPYLLRLLYSAEFITAFVILRWQAVGMFLRVISWPAAFIMLAQGRGAWAFWSELATNLLYVCACWLCISWQGLSGIGIAFMFMYIFHVGLMTLVARRLIGLHWAARNLRLIALFLPMIVAALLASYFLTPALSAVVGLALALGAGAYSLRALYWVIGPAAVLAYWIRFRVRLGLNRDER